MKGKASEVRFIRHDLATDVTALIGPHATEQGSGSMELIVRLSTDGGLICTTDRESWRAVRDTLLSSSAA